MNFDSDPDCPDDLVVKNGIGRIELLTLAQKEDGTYEVTDCIEEEDGEGFADSIALMCEEIGIDLDSFYEALALNDLLYICNLHDFMEAHPEYDHIEYIGEMVTLDDLHEMIEEEFDAYLALYAIDAALTEAETEPTEGEDSESADGESADAESADGERADAESADGESADAESADAESADAETIEGEADAELFDLHELIDLMLNEIVETAINVDLEAKEAVTGDEFSEEGTVFTLLEDVLNEIFSGRSDLGL